jgi:hypothetical protein
LLEALVTRRIVDHDETQIRFGGSESVLDQPDDVAAAVVIDGYEVDA